MSLEQALAENNVVMNNLIIAVTQLTAAMHAKGGNGKVMAEATKLPSEAAIEKEVARVVATKTPAMTQEKFNEQWADYLKVDDDDERNERKNNIRAVANHFKVKKMSEIGKEKWPDALKVLKQLKGGESPSFIQREESVI